MAAPVLHQGPLPLVASEFCSPSAGWPSSRRQRSPGITEVSPAPDRPGQPRRPGAACIRFPVCLMAREREEPAAGGGRHWAGRVPSRRAKKRADLLDPGITRTAVKPAGSPETRAIRSRAGRDGGYPSLSERSWGACLRRAKAEHSFPVKAGNRCQRDCWPNSGGCSCSRTSCTCGRRTGRLRLGQHGRAVACREPSGADIGRSAADARQLRRCDRHRRIDLPRSEAPPRVLCLRIFERPGGPGVMLAVGVVFLMLRIPLAQQYSGTRDGSVLSALARVAQEGDHYSFWIGMLSVAPVAWCCAGSCCASGWRRGSWRSMGWPGTPSPGRSDPRDPRPQRRRGPFHPGRPLRDCLRRAARRERLPRGAKPGPSGTRPRLVACCACILRNAQHLTE